MDFEGSVMRRTCKAWGFLLGVSVFILLLSEAQAVPSFAGQTGMACVGCHAQNFPALNSFGRFFRVQGYTMRGAAPLVEGEGLSIPADLKASLITKLRYQVDGNNDGDRGEVQWPDEAALLIGGRASESIGFLLEAGLGPQEGEADPVTGETEVGGNFLSFKTHFNAMDNMAVVLYGTDGLGAGYGMELMNTGLQRSQRPIENRSGFSAGQRLGTASGEATGIAFVYHNRNLMLNYSHWLPTWGNVNANILGGLAHYFRLNYFTNAGSWDIGFGANWMDGTVKTGADEEGAVDSDYAEINVAGSGVDFQALGELGGMPIEFYVSYGAAPSGSVSSPEQYNASITDDKTAYGGLCKLGVIADTSLYIAYGSSDDGTDEVNDTTVGAQYMLAQNARLELYNVSNIGDDDAQVYTMLVIFAGF
jgi:hypothetical protein